MTRLLGLVATSFAIAVLCSCSGGGDSGSIASPPAAAGIVIAPASPPPGTMGVAYAYSFTVSGGGTPPLKWTASGNMPPGLGLTEAGQLVGTPSAAGTYVISVMVSDSSIQPLTDEVMVALVTYPALGIAAVPAPPAGIAGSAYFPFNFSTTGGTAPFSWAETGSLPAGLTLSSSSGALSGTPTQAGSFSFTVSVTDSSPVPAHQSLLFTIDVYPASPNSFTLAAGSMMVPRAYHTATLLKSGKVLITGGVDEKYIAYSSAEIYDPVSETFAATGSMTQPRTGHTAIVFGDATLPGYGKVLLIGGDAARTTAELYDPAAGTFTPTGTMQHARSGFTATLLSTGKVLVVGGDNWDTSDLSAELYDPATGTFTLTGNTNVYRLAQTATLLTSGVLAGQVLITGGSGSATAELYNPVTGMFTGTGSMTVKRAGHMATLLGSGGVLVIGQDGTADLFDPNTQRFTRIGTLAGLPNFNAWLSNPTLSVRNDGSVLMAGGTFEELTTEFVPNLDAPMACRQAGEYASADFAALLPNNSAAFALTNPLKTSRGEHTATLLPDGTVLMIGGVHRTVVLQGECISSPSTETILSSAELFK